MIGNLSLKPNFAKQKNYFSMKNYYKSLVIVVVITFIISCTPTVSNEQKNEDKNAPDKVILMIGDGMGLAQINVAMIANRSLNLERAPVTGLVKTYSADNLITDSAAGATAMATGEKTKNGAIAVDTSGAPLTTLVELAESNGFHTGIIATSSITHATPAAFYAHNKTRNDEEGIAAALPYAGVDVFMGGGRKYFNQRTDENNLINELKSNGYEMIGSLDDMDNAAAEKIGYFVDDEHPVSYVSGRGNFLPEATGKALNFLNNKNEQFFMMIEGSQIDWGGHANDLKYVITEMIDFDRAVGKVLDFAEKDGNTLVIITADHETGGLALTGGDLKSQYVEGDFIYDSHTAVMVPVFAYGPGSSEFSGIQDNTDLNKKIKNLLNFN
jgi:alkaline phosphatase